MAQPQKSSDVSTLVAELDYRKRLQQITNQIHAASNIDEAVISQQADIVDLFGAEALTLYLIDTTTGELVSRYRYGSNIKELRLAISPNSLAGFCAFKSRMLNIPDVHDTENLAKIDPDLSFDSRWDRESGFTTKQVLAVPILFKQYLLGVAQFINQRDNSPFTQRDEASAEELTHILGIAIYNNLLKKQPRPHKFQYLISHNFLTKNELTQAVLIARNKKITVETVLMEDYKVEKAEIGRSLTQFYDTPFVAFDPALPKPLALLANLKMSFLQSNLWTPLSEENNSVRVLIDNPNDLHRRDLIRSLFPERKVEFLVGLREDILRFIQAYAAEQKKPVRPIEEIMKQLEGEKTAEDEDDKDQLDETDNAVVQLVNRIIVDAYDRKASDIHIEPFPGKLDVQVRLRIDGECVLYRTIPFNFRNAVVSRIKIMANLDITERRKPQDGKIKFREQAGRNIELRVATIPTQGEVEDIVMRILAAGEPIPLHKMGFSEHNYERLVSCITKPYGLVLVCGPTGSGKTTTLHSALSYINKADVKIWTAEDPVEITQRGLRQVQVQSKIGFDFAAAMRSFLRADPDVIMVGEMRDTETTHIGIEASLTGHLVFSTLHTNSAPESITRLLDMGMDPFNFADAILCIMAQRLVRTLCKTCRVQYHPSKDEYDDLVREYGGSELFEARVKVPYAEDLLLYQAKGCDACHNTGYRGRMGIHELLLGTDELKRMIQEKAKIDDLRRQSIVDGMRTLKQDGIEKVFAGHTDLLQIRKVCIK